MEIEKDSSIKNLTQTIIINSDKYPILNAINLETEQNLRVILDVKDNSIRKNTQLNFTNVMQALNKAEIIELKVGMRFERIEKYKKKEGDWIHFIKGIGQSTKTLIIQIGDDVLNNSNLAQFGQELLRLNYLEKFHLQIGKEKNLDVSGFTQLGKALGKMTQLQDLSIIIGDNCLFRVKEAKNLFCEIEACEKIRILKVHIGSNNCLKSEGTEVISAAVGQLKQVNDFDLFIDQTNDIGNEGIQYITNNILQQHLSKSVEKLSLVIDEMKATKEEIIVQIFTAIEGFTQLKDLSLELGVKKVINEYSIKIIRASLKKLTSLLRISISINSDPCALYVTPMVDLLTRFELSDNLVNLQLVIPPNNEFNNSVLSLFAVNLKRLQQLQTFSLEILENNIQGNSNRKRKVPTFSSGKTDKQMTKQQELIAQPRGISDIQESLSSLKQLELVEWIISTQNDVSDGGWEMLSLSQSLRKFRVNIGEQCKLQDEGLRSLSKISSSISLESLRIEVLDQNETSQNGWSKLLSSVNLEKMQDFKLFVGALNECSKKSLGSLAEAFERTSPHIEYLSLDFKESNNISSNLIHQLVNSLKAMVNLKQLEFIIPEDLVIKSSTLDSMSNNLEKMSDLNDLRIFFQMKNNGELFDEIKLCSTICSLRKLQYLNLHVEGNGQLKGSSIISQVKSFEFPILLYENLSIFEFRTENGLQFQKELTKKYVSEEEILNLAECLALSELAQEFILYLRIQINSIKQSENCPKFTPIISLLSGFKKCIQLKLEIYHQFFSEIPLIQLIESIVCMPSLQKLSLRLEYSILPLKAAETLATFFENSPRITKVRLTCKSNPDIDQSQVEFLLMSSILNCPNLRHFQVFFESYSKIKFEYKNQPKIEDLLLVSQMKEEGDKIIAVVDGEGHELVKKTTESVILQESIFQFLMKDVRKPMSNESLINMGQFFIQTKLLQTIKLQISSKEYISTEIASSIQKGIMNQTNLTDLLIEFTGQCFVSGEGAVVLSQSFLNQKNKINNTITIQADNTFSKDNAFAVLVSILKDQNLQNKRDHLEITGTKFILTTEESYSKQRNPILKISYPFYIALFQRISLDYSEAIYLSQISDSLSQIRDVSNLQINASHNILYQDWSSFWQLSFLTSVLIQDKSPITSSRFLSLESSLSHMTHLKSLTLNLSHIHENLYSQETIIVPFGKCLNNLKEITQFTITLKDFNFGEDGGQALGYGIEGMTDLESLEIECINPQHLPTEGIKYLCEVISKSSQIQQFYLSFNDLLPSLEIPYFNQLKNQLWDKQKSLKKASIQINGEINLAFGSIRKFQQINYPIEINRNINQFHELKLPSKYCFKSAFEKIAFNKCTDILQVFYSSSNETYSIENLTVVFNFNILQQIEPNLIFLKTLLSVLQHQQRRVKLLTIEIILSENGQFQFIYERALKDIKLVDTFSLNLRESYPYEYNIQEFYLISSLDSLINLKIVIKNNEQNLKQFRQRIMRKMIRLCYYELN